MFAAQVTNPPIDPLREGLVMSLLTFTGKARNLLDETPEHCRQLQEFPRPILTNDDIQRLRTVKRNDFKVAVLPALFAYSEEEPEKNLAAALDELVEAGERAIGGRSVAADPQRPRRFARHVAIPSLLATSALHHGLLKRPGGGLVSGIVVESGDREVMHFCLLWRWGQRDQPYMAFEGIQRLHADGDLPETTVEHSTTNTSPR